MLFVFFWRRAGHENVIEVDEHKVNVSQDTIHEALEGLSSILQSKREAQELEQPERCDDCSLRYRALSHRDVVVAAHQVDNREDRLPGQTLVEIMDVRKRVSVINGDVIESPVVTAGAPAAIGFGHHVEW